MAAATWYGSVFGRRTAGVYVPSKYAVDRRPPDKNYETARFYAGRFAIPGYHLFSGATLILMTQGTRMMFGLNSEERERRRKVRRDREHLEPRSRRFLKIYLNADEGRKPDFYRVINDAVATCYPDRPPPGLQDAEIADGASLAALKIVLVRIAQIKDDPTSDFLTDAYATVGVAYHRAAGAYELDQDLQKLGTAAVHLLTIATP